MNRSVKNSCCIILKAADTLAVTSFEINVRNVFCFKQLPIK